MANTKKFFIKKPLAGPWELERHGEFPVVIPPCHVFQDVPLVIGPSVE